MKNLKLLLSFLLNILLIALLFYLQWETVQKYLFKVKKLSFWQNRNEYYSKLSVEPESIVIFGDSQIQSFAITEHFDFTGIRIYNRGIIGDTTAGVFSRLKYFLVNGQSINNKAIVILVGVNDLIKGVEKSDIERNFQKIIDLLKKTKQTAYICSILPVLNRFYKAENKEIIRINRKIKQIIELTNLTNLNYIDLHSKFIKEGELNHKYHCGDGLHLNFEGYELLARNIKYNLRIKEEK